MSDHQPAFEEMLKHIDEIHAKLQQMSERLDHLQVELAKKRSMLANWWAVQKDQSHQHFGQPA